MSLDSELPVSVPPSEKRLLLSVVVPVYKEEGNVPEFLRRMDSVLADTGMEWEIIFALDPSPDRTAEVILEANARDRRIKLIEFSRRFGQPSATLAGMRYSKGTVVLVMDVDLQDPPELLHRMLEQWRAGCDVAYAQRTNRDGETAIKKLVAWAGYWVIDRIAEVKIPRNTGDFRLMSRRVVDRVLELNETHGFLRGMVALAGFRQVAVPFERPARHSGPGNYNRFLGSLRIGLNGIFCFSNAPLSLAWILGLACMALAGLVFLGGLILSASGLVPAMILFLGGVQLVCTGILGEYLARVYDEVRRRPRFIVQRAVGFEADAENPGD